MFILDTLLLSPIYATVWAARHIHSAIQQERAAEPAEITAELSELYMRLDAGQISEQEFDSREKELLDRLDQLQGQEIEPGQIAEEKPRQVNPENEHSKPRKSARK
jgi:hypothetical protein